MSLGELFVAQIVDRGHGRAAIADGDDVRRGEEYVRRAAAQFPTERLMGPQPALGHDDALGISPILEQIIRG